MPNNGLNEVVGNRGKYENGAAETALVPWKPCAWLNMFARHNWQLRNMIAPHMVETVWHL